MRVQVLELVEGARQARGLTVVIDVFRAFTLECYLFANGASRVYPVGAVDDALAMKRDHPDWVTFGERGGARVEGFEHGNSPAEALGLDLAGRTCIHTTSAGTQGIVNATGATEIVTASLVNAAAVARYVRERAPKDVSIVAMGNAGVRTAEEDVLCARYLEALLANKPFDVQPMADALARTAGAKFFDPAHPEFPQEDFPLCVDCDRFDFVIRTQRDEAGRLVNGRV